METVTVIITEEMNEQPRQELIVVVYARVSANENRPNLDSQAERVCAYCTVKGWKVVKEVDSGVNDRRRKLLALLVVQLLRMAKRGNVEPGVQQRTSCRI
jgi:putative resolvase